MNVFEKIIEKLEEDKEWYETHSIDKDFNRGIIGAFSRSISVIQKVAEEHNNGWIQISSGKRPKDNQFILFTVKLERGGNLVTFYNTKYGFYEEHADRFVISDGSVNTMPFGEVIAWQPLPEPYEEREKCEVKK